MTGLLFDIKQLLDCRVALLLAMTAGIAKKK